MVWKHTFCATIAAFRKAGTTDMNGFAELTDEDQDLVRRVFLRDAEAIKEAKEKSAALLLLQQSVPAKRAAKAPKSSRPPSRSATVRPRRLASLNIKSSRAAHLA